MINHRHYTYDYRRPRVSNPTQYYLSSISLSSSVGNSLSYFAHRPLQLPDHPMQQEMHHEAAYQEHRQPQQQSRNNYHAEPVQAEHMNTQNPQDRYPPAMQAHTPLRQQRKINQSLDHSTPMSKRSEPAGAPSRGLSRTVPSHIENSRFSQLGASVLNQGDYLMPAFNEDEVYRKQEKRFNIITLKPREHEQVLRQYPKLTLEDKDDYFYRRMQLQRKEMDQSLYRDNIKHQEDPTQLARH